MNPNIKKFFEDMKNSHEFLKKAYICIAITYVLIAGLVVVYFVNKVSEYTEESGKPIVTFFETVTNVTTYTPTNKVLTITIKWENK